jgi:hypothetical protein
MLLRSPSSPRPWMLCFRKPQGRAGKTPVIDIWPDLVKPFLVLRSLLFIARLLVLTRTAVSARPRSRPTESPTYNSQFSSHVFPHRSGVGRDLGTGADLSKLQPARLPLQRETRELASYLASSRSRFTKSPTITAASAADAVLGADAASECASA